MIFFYKTYLLFLHWELFFIRNRYKSYWFYVIHTFTALSMLCPERSIKTVKKDNYKAARINKKFLKIMIYVYIFFFFYKRNHLWTTLCVTYKCAFFYINKCVWVSSGSCKRVIVCFFAHILVNELKLPRKGTCRHSFWALLLYLCGL